MSKIKATRDTFLKSAVASSADLPNDGKISIAAGTEIEINWRVSDRNQHDRIELKEPRNGRHTWWVYNPHFQAVAGVVEQVVKAIAKPLIASSKEVKLNVPYFDQRDNWEMVDAVPSFGFPDRTCNTTSNAMALAYCLGDAEVKRRKINAGVNQFETIYAKRVASYGDSTDHNAQTLALREFGIESYWTTTASPSDLIHSLNLGFPIVGGYLYKGSGHICAIVGYREDGFYVHDPYGARAGASDWYAIKNGENGRNDYGKFDFYTNGSMGALLWESDAPRSSNPESGWCRFITSIDGKLTGVQKGL